MKLEASKSQRVNYLVKKQQPAVIASLLSNCFRTIRSGLELVWLPHRLAITANFNALPPYSASKSFMPNTP
jgi:hypothetical protein